jgi:sulfhydrogenase subunit gamma (sulfur reductase)
MARIELVPRPAVIKHIINESRDVKSFVIEMQEGRVMHAVPGQFVEVSVQGMGEATFAVSRLIQKKKQFIVSVKRLGHLTKMLHRSAEGNIIGVRGPYGNNFPLDEWQGKDVMIIGGGIGLAPLRPVIDHILAHRSDYGHLDIIFGARSPEDILFKEDLEKWQKAKDIVLYTAIDIPHEGWEGRVGLIPAVVRDVNIKPDDRIAVICGPPVMIRFTVAAMKDLGWPEHSIYTTLEMKMQCGIGQCGRCNIGEKFICKDGPVFRLDEIPAYALIE